MNNSLSELVKSKNQIHQLANDFGLDYYEMIYEIVPSDIMYALSSYGMPYRFSHWSFGKKFDRQQKMRKLGLMKIYELVFNTNPCYAYLLEDNSLLENKLIIAHVLAHSDFFKNNFTFQSTDKHMIHIMKRHAEIIQEYEKEYGEEIVEKTLDAALSIEEHIPILETLIKDSPHMDDWQRNIFKIVKLEIQYFFPQIRTKIINEGWATYWHTRIMRELNIDAKEILDYTKMHAGVVKANPTSLNPYLLGYKMFQRIEELYGIEKLFEVRSECHDVSFIRQYFDEAVAERCNMYLYDSDYHDGTITTMDAEKIKNQLLKDLVNGGFPYIEASFEEDGFHLYHAYEGRPLDVSQCEKVLHLLEPFIQQPVFLHTKNAIFQDIVYTLEKESFEFSFNQKFTASITDDNQFNHTFFN